MAISAVEEYAHLTEADIEAIGAELDSLRREIESSRGERDARYIRNTIRLQRALEIGGRLALVGSNKRGLWWLGAGLLGTAKIVENMELGHNIMHGQWDWMNDPEIHSSTWEWDNVDPSAHWKHTHNYMHHKYTNILGMDADVGYGLLRVTRDQRWTSFNYGNLAYNSILALFFQYGIAIQLLELGKVAKGRDDREETKARAREVLQKVAKQNLKDYVLFPALTGPNWKTTITATFLANTIRNLWTNAVIFCGHFPDGAEKFTKADIDAESQATWYLRQMLGSANISGGRVIDFLTGNLSYQIEHHVFPDLPSNRYHEISLRVRALCEKYDLPYTTGPLPVQYFKAWRTMAKLSLPDHLLSDTRDDAPETASEAVYAGVGETDPTTGRRRGLATAIARTRKPGRLRALLGMR